MKKTLLCILTALLTIYACGESKIVYNMGEPCGVDSSKASGRSFPKRLVMPKGAMGAGFQFLWTRMDASDVQALAMVTGLTGKASFGNVAPSFMYTYADNNAIGVRLSYTNINLDVTSGQVKLLTDDLKLSLDGLNSSINSYGASVFNRSWFGLDKMGRIALFADVDLGYSYGDTRSSGAKAITNSIALTFSPGIEFFVMNNLSLFFSLSFANISYDMSTSYKWIEGVSGAEGYWDRSGSSNSFNAQVRLNILDLHLGLVYYF